MIYDFFANTGMNELAYLSLLFVSQQSDSILLLSVNLAFNFIHIGEYQNSFVFYRPYLQRLFQVWLGFFV